MPRDGLAAAGKLKHALPVGPLRLAADRGGLSDR